ncbi:multicopper oxidase domain-containing protein [Gordonia alkaliphila]|uniref:multicopper oxidase domain-containing protein n=1 Tax=Gordonia alkaliphila TaxID=1053547 RepID=UPI0027E30011|nr:multicopper oxidase domain-containing protein [Gordonia alkaliphila]
MNAAAQQTPTGPGSAKPDTRRPRSWHQRAGMPVRVWMVVLIGIGLTHFALPESRWLIVHVFTIGLVANSILVWSQTLAERFLGYHLPPERRLVQLLRIYTLNLGLLVTIVGMLAVLWPVTLVGAVLIGTVVAWHAWALARLIVEAQRHRHAEGQGPAENAISAWFFVASACLLPFGAAAGVLLAYGFADPQQAGFLLTHQALNVLGFLGLATAGVLLVMYPRLLGATQVRNRRRPYALVVLPTAIAVICAGALADLPVLAAAGVGLYLAGWLLIVVPFVPVALRHPPDSYASASISAALLWLLGSLVAYLVVLLTGPFEVTRLSLLSMWFLAGFAGQLLLGVMSHLLPTLMGGGPVTAAGAAEMNRWWLWRVLVINGGLVLWLLPLGSWAKVGLSSLVMLAFILFLPIMILSARAAMQVRRALAAEADAPDSDSDADAPSAPAPKPGPQRGLQSVAAAAALALVVSVATALGGSDAAVIDASGSVAPTGKTETVQVDAVGMRFTPETITVAPGDRLILTVTNKADQVHDLVLETGQSTGRLAPGASATIDVGVVGRAIEGWCSIVGHRQQGMVLHIRTTGDAPDTGGSGGHQMDMSGGSGAAPPVDLMDEPGPGFVARDPRLAPAPAENTHKYTFTVTEGPGEVAPGVRQTLWTYNGTAMGPTLRGKRGDVFEITLVNNGTMAHSIDFHAGMVSPDTNMRDINPGERLVYRFTAVRTGIWLYHCATMPMPVHLAAGMFGAVVIDPPDLSPVDAEYLFTQSEWYLGPDGGPIDAAKVAAGVPDLVMFNGYANQYVYRPLRAKVGDRLRLWVLDAGPNEPLSFHVIGTLFDTVYSEGAYQLRRDDPLGGGSQALGLLPAQGGFVELTFTEPGTYTFLNHRMFDSDRGAMGEIIVD